MNWEKGVDLNPLFFKTFYYRVTLYKCKTFYEGKRTSDR